MILQQNNLDRLAARTANAVVQEHKDKCGELDRIATKALGVFQENGVYAGMLFLSSRTRQSEREVALGLRGHLLGMLAHNVLKPLDVSPGRDLQDLDEILRYVAETVSEPLERVLFVKSLCEQVLIYTRYAAKAKAAEAELSSTHRGSKNDVDSLSSRAATT